MTKLIETFFVAFVLPHIPPLHSQALLVTNSCRSNGNENFVDKLRSLDVNNKQCTQKLKVLEDKVSSLAEEMENLKTLQSEYFNH